MRKGGGEDPRRDHRLRSVTCDAFHITAPDESGEGIARAILFALEGGNSSGRCGPHQRSWDFHSLQRPVETLAIKNVFGDHAYKININSIKSMIGHCLGACGGIEAIATVLAVKTMSFRRQSTIVNSTRIAT